MLSVPRFEEQQDKLELLEVESLFFDGDGDARRAAQSRGKLVAAGAGAGGGHEGSNDR